MSGFVTKDSGERARFESGMQRDTEAGKARFDLLHPVGVPYKDQFLTRVAELMGRGAEKYEDRNWEKADSEAELARMKSSAYRHFMQWLTGETDEDHAAAVVFNLLAHESIRFKIVADSNTLEAEDPLVDIEGFVGADSTLLERLAYWSKRLREAWDSDEHAHRADEIEYAEDNLDDVLNLLRERNFDYVEEPGPLLDSDGWETVGYVDETQLWPDSNSFAILQNPDYVLPFREPNAFSVGVEWKSPALPTLIDRNEALEKLLYGGITRHELMGPAEIEMTQEQYDALKARCIYETGGKWSLPEGTIGTFAGVPIKIVEDDAASGEAHADGSDCYGQCARPDFATSWVQDYDVDFPRVKLDQWYRVGEIPEFGQLEHSALKPLMDKIREDSRRMAQAVLTGGWPKIITAGLPPHRTFVVDSDGEIEIEDLLQDAFNRRGIITTT